MLKLFQFPTRAAVCAKAYVTHIIARHGTKAILVTDQGVSFNSVFFKEACRILGIKVAFISTKPTGECYCAKV